MQALSLHDRFTGNAECACSAHSGWSVTIRRQIRKELTDVVNPKFARGNGYGSPLRHDP